MRTIRPDPERRTTMTIDTNTMIADAKRAARRLARTCGRTYQECLDDVARGAGRRHWSDFLADPVDVRAGRRAVGKDITIDPAANGRSAAGVIPDLLGGDAPVIVNDPKPDVHLPEGHSFRMDLDAVSRLLGGEGIVLGMNGARIVRSARNATVLCVGQPGTRKTSTIAIPTLTLSPNASQIVHDVKPELMLEALRLRGMGLRADARLLAFDPLGGAVPEGIETIAFNPLHPEYRNGRSVHEHAKAIASTLIPMRPPRDAYFTVRARALLKAIIVLLVERPDQIPGPVRRTPSLIGVTDWLARTARTDATRAFRQAAAACGEDPDLASVKDEMTIMSLMADGERSGILGTIDAAILFTKSSGMRSALEPADPDDGAVLMRALRDPNGPTSVYLAGRMAEAPAAAPAYALMLDEVVGWRARQGPSTRSLQVVIDEARRLRPVPAIDAILRDGPAAGVSLLIVETGFDVENATRSWATGDPLTMRLDHVVDLERKHTDEDIRTIAALVGARRDTMPPPSVMDADDDAYVVVARDGNRALSPCRLTMRPEWKRGRT